MVRCRIRQLVFETLKTLNPPVPRLLQAVEIAKPSGTINTTGEVMGIKESRGFSDWTDIASSFVNYTFPEATSFEQERLVLFICSAQFIIALIHYYDNSLTLDAWYHNIAEGMEREPQEMLRSTKVLLTHLTPLLKEHLVKNKDAPMDHHQTFNPWTIDHRQTVRLRAIQPAIDRQLECDEGCKELTLLGPLPTRSDIQCPDIDSLLEERGQDFVDRNSLRAVFYLYRAVAAWFSDQRTENAASASKGDYDQSQEVVFLTTHSVLSHKTLSSAFKAVDLAILSGEDRKALLINDVDDGDRAKAFLLSLGLARNTYTDDDDWSELDNWTKSLVGIVARRVEGMYKGGRSLGWN